MPRKERMEYAGGVYHVMDRGDRLEVIYEDDRDREMFLHTLGQACERTGWRVHSYVLMGNHYHLLLETPEPNLCAGMKWMQGTYTIRHNARHKLRGHLFQGRYKAIIVDGEQETYFRTVSDYIHLNPVRASLLAEGAALETYRWSSFPALAGLPRKRPAWLTGEWVLGGFGENDSSSGRRRYREALEQRALEERSRGAIEEGMLKALRRGWCFGSEEFRQRLLELPVVRGRPKHSGGQIQHSHDEKEAVRLIESGVKALKLTRQQLATLPKGDPRKIAVALVVKKRTVVTNGWIAGQLNMGAPSRVSRYCSQAEARADVKPHIEKLQMSISKD